LKGSKEAFVHCEIPFGSQKEGGAVRNIAPDGTISRSRPDGTPIRSRSTNLFDEIARFLPTVQNHEYLERVTLINNDERKIVFVRQGSRWTRES
jgi:hypothetical protein